MRRLEHTPFIKALPVLALTAAISQVHAAERATMLEEVVVTAQKKAESLQDTPIAISAFSAESMMNKGITNAADVGEYTPNVTITPSLGSSFNIRMSVRGLGTAEPSLAIDPKVGVYLDGAYIARNAGAVFDVVDLERVEVLRGPQGTLWGKNTTGGAVNMVTQKPSGELGFKQQFTAGNDGLFRSTTTVDTPEVAGLSSKLTYMKKEYDGWAKNTSTSPIAEKDLGSEDTEAFRLAVRWMSDFVTVDYSFDRTNGEAVSIPVQVSDVNASTAATSTLNFATGDTYNANALAQMQAIADGKNRQETFNVDGQGREHVDIDGHNLTFSWSVGDVEIKSISAYREYDSIVTSLDSDGGAYVGINNVSGQQDFIPVFHTNGEKNQHQFSQEFQIVGSALDSRLNYVAGIYYFEETGKEVNPWALTYAAGATNYLVTERVGNWYEIKSESKAAYGQATYDFTDQLSVTFGLRYTNDKKALTLLDIDPSIDENVKDDETWGEWTSAITVNYQVNDDVSVYAKVAEGFASGVYNPGAIRSLPDPAAGIKPVDPEETTAYEVGMKSMWLDQTLQFNAAAFYNDNKNLQVTDLVDGIRTSLNSGESDSNGVEIEVIALPMAGLMISGSYGYIHSNVNDYVDPVTQDVSSRFVTTPHNTGTLGVQYDFDIGFGLLTTYVDATYTDKSGFSSSDKTVKADERTLFNARVGLSEVDVANGEVRVALWGRNLSDEEYIVHGANFGTHTAYTWGQPRSYGVDVSYEF